MPAMLHECYQNQLSKYNRKLSRLAKITNVTNFDEFNCEKIGEKKQHCRNNKKFNDDGEAKA